MSGLWRTRTETIYLESDGRAGTYAHAVADAVGEHIFSGGPAGAWGIAFWMRAAADPPQDAIVFAFEANTAADPVLRMLSNGDGSYLVQIRGASWSTTTCTVASDGDWHLVGVHSDGATFGVVVDGVEQDTASVEATYSSAERLTLFDDRTHAAPAAVAITTFSIYGFDVSEADFLYLHAADVDAMNELAHHPIDLWLWSAGPVGGSVDNTGDTPGGDLTLRGWLRDVFELWPTGTHSVRVVSNLLDTTALDFAAWAFDFATPSDATTFGEAPRVTGVEGTVTDLTLYLDAALQPGIGYTLTPPGLGDYDFTGPRRSLAREHSPDDRVLLDIDAPFIRPDGAGGNLTIDESGDYRLTGGLATVEKAIWDAIFATRGERYWDPTRGTDLRHKQLRPLDVRGAQRELEAVVEAIPYVRAAVVQLLWDAGHMVISVKADTDFGRLETSRGVDDG